MRLQTDDNRDHFDPRWLLISMLIITAWLFFKGVCSAQIASANPLEYAALTEGNLLINSQIDNQIKQERETALLQNTIAAEFMEIHSWEKKYNSYLKDVDGYASSLKACSHIYDDGVRLFLNLSNLKTAICNNPQGVIASMSMNNLYMETATELISVYTLLKDAITKGGKENMLTGAERSKTLWAINDRLVSLNKKLSRLELSIRYYTLTDVWNKRSAGMLERDKRSIATEAYGRWRRCSRIANE